jgi:hypothetical protein
MDAPRTAVAVIVDVSRSRTHADRAALQRDVQEAFARVNAAVASAQPLEPTVGDESQAVYADLASALRATLLARLELPDGVDCRFGLGLGELATIGSGVVGAVQDGSAWWSAREAIDEARKHEYSKLAFVRTWYRVSSDPGATDDTTATSEALVNSYLLARDHIVGTMTPRSRHLLRGQLSGATQIELARLEGISQSAVSQSLSRSGANAIVAGAALLTGGAA